MDHVFGAEFGGTIDLGDKTVAFRNGRLLKVGSARILIASGEALSAAHPDPGYVGLWYLGGTASDPVVTKGYPRLVETGTFGAAPEWKIIHHIADEPVLEVTGFGMWFGHAYTWTTLVALSPESPQLLLDRVLTSYEWDPGDDPAETEPAGSFSGQITYDRSRDQFAVRYSGTVAGKQVYVRRGDTYVPATRLPAIEPYSKRAIPS